MAKKAAKSAKKNADAASPAKPARPAKTTKSSKKEGDASLLSDELFGKIEQFSQIYQEINDIIEVSGKKDSFDLSEKERIISEKIEEECSKVLKNEIQEAERWIVKRQEDLKDQIQQLENAFESIRNTLEKTNAFNGDEVAQTLSIITDKVSAHNVSLEGLEELLQKARSAYA